MTPTAPIATNTAPASDAGTAPRAAPKNTPSDEGGSFDSLVGKSHDDAKDAQTKAKAPAKTDSAKADSAKADEAKPGDPEKDAAPQTKLVDQALLAQLKLLGAKDGKSDKADNADDDTKTQPRGKAKAKTADAAAVPTNAILQQLLAKTPAQDQIKLAASNNKKTQPIIPHHAGEEAAAASKDGKDAAGKFKAPANPADAPKQQSAPAQNTLAKALNVHFDAANANGNNGQHTGDQKQSDQQNRGAKTAPDATPSPDLKQAAAQAIVPQAPAHTQTQTQTQIAPQTPDNSTLAAAAPTQAVSQAPQPLSASLQVAAQSAGAASNLTSLAVNIVAKSKDGKKDFDIRLDPAELGRVDVKLSIDDAGKTQATLQAEKPQTLELLQRDRGTLERALRDAGLDLAGGGLNFSLKGQSQDSGGKASSGRSRNLSVSAIAGVASAASLASTQISSADSRLDIRV